MSETQGPQPDFWWLLAVPATGALVGTTLGVVWGWLATPGEGVGPLVGEPVGSMVVGGLVGMTLGVFTGVVVGAVLMFVLRLGTTRRNSPSARMLAAGVAAVCCPAVLVVLAGISRVDVGQLGLVLLAIAAAAGAGTCGWLAGRAPVRT